MKKLFAILLTAAMLVTALSAVACNSKPGDPAATNDATDTAAVTEPDDPIEITKQALCAFMNEDTEMTFMNKAGIEELLGDFFMDNIVFEEGFGGGFGVPVKSGLKKNVAYDLYDDGSKTYVIMQDGWEFMVTKEKGGAYQLPYLSETESDTPDTNLFNALGMDLSIIVSDSNKAFSTDDPVLTPDMILYDQATNTYTASDDYMRLVGEQYAQEAGADTAEFLKDYAASFVWHDKVLTMTVSMKEPESGLMMKLEYFITMKTDKPSKDEVDNVRIVATSTTESDGMLIPVTMEYNYTGITHDENKLYAAHAAVSMQYASEMDMMGTKIVLEGTNNIDISRNTENGTTGYNIISESSMSTKTDDGQQLESLHQKETCEILPATGKYPYRLVYTCTITDMDPIRMEAKLNLDGTGVPELNDEIRDLLQRDD